MTTSDNHVPQQQVQPYPGQQQHGYVQPMPGVPAHAQYAQPQGPVGQVRGTGLTMLLFVVTFGIWGFVYYYRTHEEMKRHSGEGIGGVLGMFILVGPIIWFVKTNGALNAYWRSLGVR